MRVCLSLAPETRAEKTAVLAVAGAANALLPEGARIEWKDGALAIEGEMPEEVFSALQAEMARRVARGEGARKR